MVNAVLDELEALLTEEREAIRRLDGDRVLQYSGRKKELVSTLQARRAEVTPDAARRFRALASSLRHNGILLAHARNVLRDSVAVLARRSGIAALPAGGFPSTRRLSVRG
jgi:hypothetical protein